VENFLQSDKKKPEDAWEGPELYEGEVKVFSFVGDFEGLKMAPGPYGQEGTPLWGMSMRRVVGISLSG